MTLFAPGTPDVPGPPADPEPPASAGRPSRRVTAGLVALAVAVVAIAALTFLPTGYVIQQAGPVYDTLGVAETNDGEEVPLIAIDGAETFPTTGSLSLTTVRVLGNPERTPTWAELVAAWFDSSRAVIPLENVFPPGVSVEQRSEESAQMMVDSQQDATAAALSRLGYDTDPRLDVFAIPEGSPAEGILRADDVIRSVDGTPTPYISQLRAEIQRADGGAVTLGIERDGEALEEEIEPVFDETSGSWLLGVSILPQYTFPIDVTIQLDQVGGPSAGQMFALGIMDTLTPEDLTGGADIAGTGTIDGEGEIGAIGGIRQKLVGARDAGASVFLAPQSNCDEVTGHIPDGLEVFAVEDLDDSLAALAAIRDGDTAALATCPTR